MQGSGWWSWRGWASVSAQGWPRAVLAKKSPLGDRHFLNVFLVFDLIAHVRVAGTISCLSCNAGQKLVLRFAYSISPQTRFPNSLPQRGQPGAELFLTFPPSSLSTPSGCLAPSFPASSHCYPQALSTGAEPPSQDSPLQHILCCCLGRG